jgi:hypothetical protein
MATVGWWIKLDSEHESELAIDPKQRENWFKLAKLAALWREDEAATTPTLQSIAARLNPSRRLSGHATRTACGPCARA